MFQSVLRKRKLMAAAVSAAMVATAFQPGSCTINVDPSLIQALQEIASNFANGQGALGDMHRPDLNPSLHHSSDDMGEHHSSDDINDDQGS